MLARLGEHNEVVQKAFLKCTPSLARRSRFGVLRCGWPAQLMQSARMSSVRMTTTLGRLVSAGPGAGSRQRAARHNRSVRLMAEARGVAEVPGGVPGWRSLSPRAIHG